MESLWNGIPFPFPCFHFKVYLYASYALYCWFPGIPSPPLCWRIVIIFSNLVSPIFPQFFLPSEKPCGMNAFIFPVQFWYSPLEKLSSSIHCLPGKGSHITFPFFNFICIAKPILGFTHHWYLQRFSGSVFLSSSMEQSFPINFCVTSLFRKKRHQKIINFKFRVQLRKFNIQWKSRAHPKLRLAAQVKLKLYSSQMLENPNKSGFFLFF